MADIIQNDILQPLIDEIANVVSNAKKELSNKVSQTITETYLF